MTAVDLTKCGSSALPRLKHCKDLFPLGHFFERFVHPNRFTVTMGAQWVLNGCSMLEALNHQTVALCRMVCLDDSAWVCDDFLDDFSLKPPVQAWVKVHESSCTAHLATTNTR